LALSSKAKEDVHIFLCRDLVRSELSFKAVTLTKVPCPEYKPPKSLALHVWFEAQKSQVNHRSSAVAWFLVLVRKNKLCYVNP
jgi:hypothetical protein